MSAVRASALRIEFERSGATSGMNMAARSHSPSLAAYSQSPGSFKSMTTLQEPLRRLTNAFEVPFNAQGHECDTGLRPSHPELREIPT